jgi:hypothetical protein
MSNQFLKLRRSSVPGKTPDTASLDFGEIALNTYDGLAFMKKSGSAGIEIVTLGSGGSTINTGSFATTGSNTFKGNQIISGSIIATSITSSLLGTASLALQVSTSISTQNQQHNVLFTDTSGPGYIQVDGGLRYNPNQNLLTTTASFALNAATASSADNFTVRGTLTATTIVAQTITSSTEFITGSTRFGSLLANTHQFTGSVSVTGSLAINGNSVITSNQTSLFVQNNRTSSFATTGSNTFIGNQTITGSLNITTTAVLHVTGLNLTSSYNLNYNDYPTAIWNQQGYQFILDYGSNRLTVTKVVNNQYVQVISGYDLTQDIAGQGTWQVYGDGTYLYIISEYGFVSSWRFDTQTETLIFLSQGSKYTNSYSQIWGDGTYIYATTSDTLGGSQKLSAYHINSGILSLAAQTAETYYSYNSVFCQNGYIYVGVNSYGVIVYTYNGSSFTKVAEILDDYGDIVSINGDGKYIYIGNYGGGLLAFEHSGSTISYLTYINLSSQLTHVNTIWCDDNLIWVTSGGYDQNSPLLLAYSFDGSTFTQEISINNGGDLPTYVVSDNQYYYVLRYADIALYTRAGFNQYISNVLSITGSLQVTGSTILNGNLYITGSVSASNGFTGSLLGTASNALTASSADNFTVRGTLTATTIVAQTITSSTEFITGSTKFGSLITDTHQFTGSVLMTGSLVVSGSTTLGGNLLFATDNVYSIGNTNGTNRPSTINAAGAINSSNSGFTTTGNNTGTWFGRNFTITTNADAFLTVVGTGGWYVSGSYFRIVDKNQNTALFVTGSTGNVFIGSSLSDNGYRLQVQGSGSLSGSLYVSGSTVMSGSLTLTNDINTAGSVIATGDFYGGAFRGNYIGNSSGTNYVRVFSNNGNTLLQNGGTFTDNGYRLQVNGSGSLSGSLFVSGSSLLSGSVNVIGNTTITGSLLLSTGSMFGLPTTSSVTPVTGSMYFSGSLLFIYNGTRYMSASFV